MRNLFFAALLAVSAPSFAKGVTCKDGTISARSGRGACSHHGGVGTAKATDEAAPAQHAQPTDKTAPSADQRARNEAKEPQNGNARAENNGGILGGLFGRRNTNATPRSSTTQQKSGTPMAKCKDGTTSYSAHHSGTCSGHGGVGQWLDQ